MLENHNGSCRTYIQDTKWQKVVEPTLRYIAIDVDDYYTIYLTKQDLLNMLKEFDST